MKKMKVIIVSLLIVISYYAYGQERKLDVSFSMGGYTTPYYNKAQIGLNYSADFDYLLNNGWYISSGFNLATFNYYEPPRVDNPTVIVREKNGTNAITKNRQINVKLKKDLLNKENYNIRVGLGFSILTEIQEYPLSDVFGPGTFTTGQSEFTSLAFPVSIEPFYVIFDTFRVGVKAEVYLQPDFPLLGYNVGPQIRIRI